MNTEVWGVSSSLYSQQKSSRTDSAVCTWMLIRAVNSPNIIAVTSAAFRHNCQILLIDSLDSDPAVRGNHPSIDGQTFASLGSSLTDWLAGRLGDRVKLLPQQFQDVVRVLVSLTTHPAQLHGMQVGVRWDVGGRAVELVQGEPQGVWVHLD